MSESKRPKAQGLGHSDLFLTDPAALNPLMQFIPSGSSIWEPAAGGEGKYPLVQSLIHDHRMHVIASDIRDSEPRDFLTWKPAMGFDYCITNPPYSIKDKWIARCYELGKPWALLLPLTAHESRARQDMFKQHGVDVLYLRKRVKFTTPNGTVGGAWFPVAWFTWKILPCQAVYE